jgi:hypothetical protein
LKFLLYACSFVFFFSFVFSFSCWLWTRISRDDHTRFSYEISKEYLINEFINNRTKYWSLRLKLSSVDNYHKKIFRMAT